MADRTLTDSTDIDFTEPSASTVSAEIKTAAVTSAKMANMAQATIKGRASGAGTGVPGDLTAAQARTILNVEDGATADQSDEEIQDIVGAMLTGNTETFIAATYQDADGTIDLVVPVLDEDNMASDSAAHLATQQSIKAYVDGQAGGISNVVEDTTPQLGGDLDLNGNAITGFVIGTDIQAFDELLNEIAALSTDPNADSGLFFDDSAGNMAYWTPTLGLEFSDANLQMTANQRLASITFVIDGGGSAITTGVKGYLEIPFACTITAARALADQSGSIVVDIWKDTFANYPPTDADSITASAPVTISTATKSEDATLTGWTTTITAGDILGFNVDSITAVERVTIALTVTKT
jgi:hypothetical protein